MDKLNKKDKSFKRNLLISIPFYLSIIPVVLWFGTVTLVIMNIFAFTTVVAMAVLDEKDRKKEQDIPVVLKSQEKLLIEENKLDKAKENDITKDDIIEQLISDIDKFNKDNKLPPVYISKDDYYILFDNLYRLFEKKEMEGYFYNVMTGYVEETLKRRPAYNDGKIEVSSFVDNIQFLRGNKFNDDDIHNVKINIQKRLKEKDCGHQKGKTEQHG